MHSSSAAAHLPPMIAKQLTLLNIVIDTNSSRQTHRRTLLNDKTYDYFKKQDFHDRDATPGFQWLRRCGLIKNYTFRINAVAIHERFTRPKTQKAARPHLRRYSSEDVIHSSSQPRSKGSGQFVGLGSYSGVNQKRPPEMEGASLSKEF